MLPADKHNSQIPVYAFNAHGAIRALELIGREIGMFNGPVEQDERDPVRDILRRIGEVNVHRSLRPNDR